MIIGVDIRVLGTGKVSGVEEYTEQLLARMVSLDKNIQFKLFYAGRQKLKWRAWMNAPNVKVFDTGLSNRILWLKTRLTGRPHLDKLIDGADVFFFPHFLLGAVSPKCRRVMTWHDLSYELRPELFSLRRRLWHSLQMRPHIQAKWCDKIIAVSESTRADLLFSYSLAPEKIKTIYSGVDERLVRPSDADIENFKKRMNLPVKFILCLSTLEPRKNTEGLITAFDLLNNRDVELVIAGHKGWLSKSIYKRAADSPFNSRIRFVEDIKDEDKALWLSSASVFVYPSLMEGFGFPPLEAMTCGTSVVAAANSSMLEILGDAALLVDPYSADSIARGISTLLSDDILRQKLIERGYKEARSFSWQATAEKTLQLITGEVV